MLSWTPQNLYIGPNIEDRPALAEAAAYLGAVVVAQANRIVDRLPRVDIRGDWVDLAGAKPSQLPDIALLLTRDLAEMRKRR